MSETEKVEVLPILLDGVLTIRYKTNEKVTATFNKCVPEASFNGTLKATSNFLTHSKSNIIEGEGSTLKDGSNPVPLPKGICPIIRNPYYWNEKTRRCPNVFASIPTPFPKLKRRPVELKQRLQYNMQAAVKTSLRERKFSQVVSRFEQLSVDAGLTNADLRLLYESEHDEQAVDKFIMEKCKSENFKPFVQPAIANWFKPDGTLGGVISKEVTFRELVEQKVQAEEEIKSRNFNLDLMSPDPAVDWDHVSRQLYNKRDGDIDSKNCKRLWAQFLGPSVRHVGDWSPEDVIKLKVLVRPTFPNFVGIANKMGDGFTPLHCFLVYRGYFKDLPSLSGVDSSLFPRIYNAAGGAMSSYKFRSSMDGYAGGKRKSTGKNKSNHTPSVEASEKRAGRSGPVCVVKWNRLSLFNQFNPTEILSKKLRRCMNPVTTKGKFNVVEDALLLATIVKYQAILRDESNRQEIQFDKFLPWRHYLQWRTRLENMFDCSYEPWSIDEDRVLLFLTKKFPHNWAKISKFFSDPPRSRKALFKRFHRLKKSLGRMTLSEYHHFLYAGRTENRAFHERWNRYKLLRDAFQCLDVIKCGHELGEQLVPLLIKLQWNGYNIGALYSSSVANRRKRKLPRSLDEGNSSPAEELDSVYYSGSGDFATIRDHSYSLPPLVEGLILPEATVSEETCDRNQLDESAVAGSLSSTSNEMTSLYSGKKDEYEDVGEAADLDKPPLLVHQLRYLWEMPLAYISAVHSSLKAFLEMKKVDPYGAKQKPYSKSLHFRSDDARSFAAALYLKKVEVNSSEQLEGVELSEFENDVLEHYKWFTKTSYIKRSVKRRIPPKEQLVTYPEIRNLVYKKSVEVLPVKQDDPVKGLSNFEGEHSQFIGVELDKIKEEEPWALYTFVPSVCTVNSQGEIVITLNENEMSTVGEMSGEKNHESILPSNPALSLTPSSSPSKSGQTAVPFPTLCTVGKGRGKKSSRLAKVRSEIAQRYWAERRKLKEAVKIRDNIFENPVPEPSILVSPPHQQIDTESTCSPSEVADSSEADPFVATLLPSVFASASVPEVFTKTIHVSTSASEVSATAIDVITSASEVSTAGAEVSSATPEVSTSASDVFRAVRAVPSETTDFHTPVPVVIRPVRTKRKAAAARKGSGNKSIITKGPEISDCVVKKSRPAPLNELNANGSAFEKVASEQ